ncbi:MAG: ABC transporter ATP-binding protein [Hyphomicrobiales bacterium]
MKVVLQIFFGAKGTRPTLVLLCLLLAGVAEGIGLSSLLPVVTELGGGMQEESSPFNLVVKDTLSQIGIEPSVTNLLILIVGGLSLKAILSFVAMSYVGYAVAQVATGMRAQLINNLLRVRWSYFTDQRVGRIANAISNDATRSGLAYMVAARFVAVCFQAVIYVIVAVSISPFLAAVALGVGTGMVGVLNIFTRISQRAGWKQTDRTSELVTYVSDALNNIKPLKTMERQAAFSALFSRKITTLKKALRRQVIAQKAMIHGRELILCNAVGIGVYIALTWKIPIPELLVMGILFHNLVGIIGRAQSHLQKSVEMESAYLRLNELVREARDAREINPGTATPRLETGCRFENVVFAHDETTIIRDVSFDIPVGGITVLQGPSGAGKTTLIDLLTGLYMPKQGRILIDGTPIQDVDLRQWRRMIGYVPQELALFHDTIMLNVALGDESLTEQDVRDALVQAGAWEFISSLPEGLESTVGERGLRLSGGQRQRIALARALITRPKLLILDEVTSALDPDSELEICRNIQTLSNDYTIIAITHRPAWTDIATNLYKVDHGKVTMIEKPHSISEAV